MRINVSFQSSLFIAFVVHLLVFSVFVFTFPLFQVSPRPGFIFLGSFLRAQDVTLFSSQKPEAQAVMDIRNVKLDIRTNTVPRNLDKPFLTDKIIRPRKHQFKPSMDEKMAPAKRQEDPSDLGLDLDPIPPVKLRMGQ